jgi:hypothetical protein
VCVCAPAFRSLSIVMQSCTRVRPGHRSLCDQPVAGARDQPVADARDQPVTDARDQPVTGARDQPVTGVRARQAIAALQQLGEGDTAAGGGGGGGVAEACRSGRRDSTAGSPYPQVIYIYIYVYIYVYVYTYIYICIYMTLPYPQGVAVPLC